jgi:hypothetical protein
MNAFWISDLRHDSARRLLFRSSTVSNCRRCFVLLEHNLLNLNWEFGGAARI